jgi:hypothetical protein
MIHPMVAMTSGVSPRGIDTYNLPPTMIHSQMSLPIIKSDLNDSDPKVEFFLIIYLFSFIFLLKRKRGRPPKSKSDGPMLVASYTKHPQMNLSGTSIAPTMNNAVILNDQHGKVPIFLFLESKKKQIFFYRLD